MANMRRDDSGSDVTIDESEPKGHSVIGPLDDGQYAAWDHAEAEELGRGSREAMNKLAGERAAEAKRAAEAEAGDDEPEPEIGR